ncbi:uncharacterized protein PAF06_009413 [Gastrophryne carolinensis]
MNEHREHVRAVLSRLRTHQLYAKLEKCEFEKTAISFLGVLISDQGFSMGPSKVSAVLEWPAPTSRKEFQRFIGFVNFYRLFIRNFFAIVRPIKELTKKDKAFEWSESAQQAFQTLKSCFTSAPVLAHPASTLPFMLMHHPLRWGQSFRNDLEKRLFCILLPSSLANCPQLNACMM